MLLKDHVAVVTGASRGIGAATAMHLGTQGAAVGVNYLSSADEANGVVEAIRGVGSKAMAVRADTRNRSEVEAMAGAVSRELGPVDILVVNASIPFSMVPFLEYRWEDFQAKLNGELGSAFFTCKAFVPGMVQRRRGSIIAVSSTLSRRPADGFCAHSTAKSGLDAFMRALAQELGPYGVRVNVVAPGLTLTDATAAQPKEMKDAIARMTPLGRNAVAEDISGVITFLASDEAKFLTGAYIPVSGGNLMT